MDGEVENPEVCDMSQRRTDKLTAIGEESLSFELAAEGAMSLGSASHCLQQDCNELPGVEFSLVTEPIDVRIPRESTTDDWDSETFHDLQTERSTNENQNIFGLSTHNVPDQSDNEFAENQTITKAHLENTLILTSGTIFQQCSNVRDNNIQASRKNVVKSVQIHGSENEELITAQGRKDSEKTAISQKQSLPPQAVQLQTQEQNNILLQLSLDELFQRAQKQGLYSSEPLQRGHGQSLMQMHLDDVSWRQKRKYNVQNISQQSVHSISAHKQPDLTAAKYETMLKVGESIWSHHHSSEERSEVASLTTSPIKLHQLSLCSTSGNEQQQQQQLFPHIHQQASQKK